MQPEHEHAMRADYATYVRLIHRMLCPIVTESGIDQVEAQLYAISRRWASGPDAEHWEYLAAAHADFHRAPRTMARLLKDIDHNGGAGVTPVQHRSLRQAAELKGLRIDHIHF